MPEAPDPATPEPTPTDTAPVDIAAELEKWKALSRKHEAQAKANAEKAEAFDRLQEDSKTELEKATSRAEKAETELAQTKAIAVRAQVAAAKGLDLELLPDGITDLAALEAFADRLIAFRGPTAPPPATPEQMGMGTTGDPIGQADDPLTAVFRNI